MISKRLWFVVGFVFGLVALPMMARAATTDGAQKSNLSKQVDFDDLLVQGKYQFSSESVVTVEEDKALDGLLQIRKDFRDRIQKTAERH